MQLVTSAFQRVFLYGEIICHLLSVDIDNREMLYNSYFDFPNFLDTTYYLVPDYSTIL